METIVTIIIISLFALILNTFKVNNDQSSMQRQLESQHQQISALKARLDSWNVCVDQVANSNVDFSIPNWRNASDYLSKELAYTLTDELRQDFNSLAIETIKKELKAVTIDINASKDERSRATILFSDIISNNFEDKDLQSKIDSLRRKMIVRNYIETNCI